MCRDGETEAETETENCAGVRCTREIDHACEVRDMFDIAASSEDGSLRLEPGRDDLSNQSVVHQRPRTVNVVAGETRMGRRWRGNGTHGSPEERLLGQPHTLRIQTAMFTSCCMTLWIHGCSSRLAGVGRSVASRVSLYDYEGRSV